MSGPERKKGLFARLFKQGDQPTQPDPQNEVADANSGSDAGLTDASETAEPAPSSPPEAPTEQPAALRDAVVAEADEGPDPVEADPGAGRATEFATSVQSPPTASTSWLSRLKTGLGKTSSRLSDGITGLFTKRKLDAATLEDLEDVLIQADLGVDTAMRITSTLSDGRFAKGISAEDVRAVLAAEVQRVLEPVARPLEISAGNRPHVILMVGVNGTGKTTTIGKLAQQFAADGKKVMMAAGDTFRAAAVEQLKVWGERSGAAVLARETGADSSGLAFDALKEARAGGYDVLLIDTAGRLQNKQALMEELEKVVRVLKKLDPSAPHDVLLVLDATTGQNAMQQVEVFRQRVGVTGLVLTKLDGTARGGIIVAIADKHNLPVHAIGVGEGIEDLQPFEAGAFARAIADI